MAEFDRNVESLHKFKLELYQELESLERQAPTSVTQEAKASDSEIKSAPDAGTQEDQMADASANVGAEED